MSRQALIIAVLLSPLLAVGCTREAHAGEACPETPEVETAQREDDAVIASSGNADGAVSAQTRNTQAPTAQPSNARARWHRYLPGMFK